jgi:hypothetical protein
MQFGNEQNQTLCFGSKKQQDWRSWYSESRHAQYLQCTEYSIQIASECSSFVANQGTCKLI